jgi:peptidyl-prolyl cis-trans isomerase C
MRKIGSSIVLLCAAALIQPLVAAETKTFPAAAEPVATSAKQSPDTVIAKGKAVEVNRRQLDAAVSEFKSNASAQGKTVGPEETAMLETGMLDRLIQTQILLSKATDAEKSKAKAEAAERIQEAKTNAPSEEAFNAQLKSMGATVDQLVQTMSEQVAAEAVILRELKIDVSDAEIKKFYDDTNNTAKFEEPEMVRASHILLMTQDPKTGQEISKADKEAKHKTMEGLLKRARAGEDFAKLAKEFSEDPGSKDKGGEYTFPRGQMVPAFETAAFALKTNEVSDVITTQFGYHIIKLSEHLPAQKVALDKVSPRIKNYLKQQELAKLAPEYMAKIRKEANVEILDEKLKAQEAPADAFPGARPPAKAKSGSESPKGK